MPEISTPKTFAPALASGIAVVSPPQPRSRMLWPFVIPQFSDQRLTFPHSISDAGEITFFP
ncbi:MAG TPA: hypothetical protein VGP55_05635 [Chitinophagaceae bacterium]|nr:hypothetical protein [Chitinophagaceae bacterium]